MNKEMLFLQIGELKGRKLRKYYLEIKCQKSLFSIDLLIMRLHSQVSTYIHAHVHTHTHANTEDI